MAINKLQVLTEFVVEFNSVVEDTDLPNRLLWNSKITTRDLSLDDPYWRIDVEAKFGYHKFVLTMVCLKGDDLEIAADCVDLADTWSNDYIDDLWTPVGAVDPKDIAVEVVAHFAEMINSHRKK